MKPVTGITSLTIHGLFTTMADGQNPGTSTLPAMTDDARQSQTSAWARNDRSLSATASVTGARGV